MYRTATVTNYTGSGIRYREGILYIVRFKLYSRNYKAVLVLYSTVHGMDLVYCLYNAKVQCTTHNIFIERKNEKCFSQSTLQYFLCDL